MLQDTNLDDMISAYPAKPTYAEWELGNYFS